MLLPPILAISSHCLLACSAFNHRPAPICYLLCACKGSTRSYQVTAAEMQAMDEGKLDVLGGFTLIDNEYRLVVLEGLAGPGRGMQAAFYGELNVSGAVW